MNGERTIVVATDDGVQVFDTGGRSGNDGRTVDELAGHEVRALALGGGGPWAIVDGKELWRNRDGHWSCVTSTGRRRATCLAVTPAGMLVGTARAHLLHLEGDKLVPLAGFDHAEGREAWYTPWGRAGRCAFDQCRH